MKKSTIHDNIIRSPRIRRINNLSVLSVLSVVDRCNAYGKRMRSAIEAH